MAQKSIELDPEHESALKQLGKQLGMTGTRIRSRVIQSLVERAAVFLSPEIDIIRDKIEAIRKAVPTEDKSPFDIIYDALDYYLKAQKRKK